MPILLVAAGPTLNPTGACKVQQFIIPNQNLKSKKENKMENPKTVLFAALIALVISILFGLVLAYPIMLVWSSALVPALTIVKPIGWLQAWGIMVLCGVLFKSGSFNTNK